jgi:hypothetical protein
MGESASVRLPAAKLLWLDGLAGLTVGVLLLALQRPLLSWYGFSPDFLALQTAANLLYGGYALTLARLRARPLALVVLLASANAVWGLLCLRWAWLFRASATALGLAHLVLEALVVLALAASEWRARRELAAPSGPD